MSSSASGFGFGQQQFGGWVGNNMRELFLKNSLNNHTPRDLTGLVNVGRQEGNVLTVQKDESLPRVFRKLATEGFLGAPVLDGRKYIGFISILDLVKHVNSMFWAENEEEWVDFFEKSDEFSNTTVEDVMDTPDVWNRDPSPPCSSDFSTFHALELFANTKLHRFALLNPVTKRVSGIITQSMIISFLRQTKNQWGPKFSNLTISDFCDDLNYRVIKCRETDRVVNAFNKLEDNEITGLAIVDDYGKLTGSISQRDLRCVGEDGTNFSRLYKTVREFKQLLKQENPKLAPSSHYSAWKDLPTNALSVTLNDNIGTVIEKMNDGQIHRIYVVDSSMRPIHVISQRDVLVQALQACVEENDSSSNRSFQSSSMPMNTTQQGMNKRKYAGSQQFENRKRQIQIW